MITNYLSRVSAFFNLWKPEVATPSFVFAFKIHVGPCKLCVVSFVHLQPWLSLLIGVIKEEVVALLDAVLDNVKFDFSLLFIKPSQVLCD
jgi:hypothetical protein